MGRDSRVAPLDGPGGTEEARARAVCLLLALAGFHRPRGSRATRLSSPVVGTQPRWGPQTCEGFTPTPGSPASAQLGEDRLGRVTASLMWSSRGS